MRIVGRRPPGLGESGPPRVWPLRRSVGVRLRSALAATTVVAVAFAVAAGLFVWQYRQALVANIDDAATARANDIAAEVTGADGAMAGERIAEPGGEPNIVQVLDASGSVVAASPGLGRRSAALSPLRPAVGETLREERDLVDGGESFWIVATAAPTSHGIYTVQVAHSLHSVDVSIDTALTLIAIGFPILLFVVGAATFVFVGRSLRPVEAIRSRVATISGRDLHARVPVPPARDEVARLAETMNEMLDRLEAASEAQRRFVADASHELRSPLATLRAGLELLTTTPDAAPVVATLIEEADRLNRLIANLLLLARADDQGLLQRMSDVDLDDLVDAERNRLAHAGTHLSVRAQVQPVRVRGDAHQLAQALRNLVDNAARHARTTVTLRLSEDDSRAVVEIIDDGPGIPPADRERVFQRFVRLDESRTGEGSGLGLAIVREIARAHGGEVDIADAPASGGGTVLRLTLPRGL